MNNVRLGIVLNYSAAFRHTAGVKSCGFILKGPSFSLKYSCQNINFDINFPFLAANYFIVKLRQGSGKDRQGMALKAKGLKA